VIVRIPETPGTRATLAPVEAELARRGHLVAADGPCDVALCCTPEDAAALRRAGVRPVAFTPQRSNPGRGWAGKLAGVAGLVDLLCLPGPLYLDVLHVACPDVTHFEVLGLPRADALRAAGSTRTQVVAAHGLDPAQPLVVFAPRWHQRLRLGKARGHGTLPWLSEVVAAAEAARVQLVVLPHPREHRQRRLVLAPHVARVQDAGPYLCAADVLVTDFSPLAADFAVRDRPIIQLLDALAPRLKKLAGPANPRAHDAFDVGVHVHAADLGPALSAACAGDDPAADRRRAWVSQLFAHPGTSAARHVDALERLAGGGQTR
jgi:hypothetical protein